jgi:NAD(P)-dependent dehydrogenase (short-subunit alcohol dehydrogenase family)
MVDWTRQLAVVTGASEGIGRAIARALAGRGASLAVCSRGAAGIEELAGSLEGNGGRALGMVCDVRDERSVQAFARRVLEEMGTPTILVNNAGVGRFAPVAEMPAELWNDVIATNLTGMFLVTRAFLPAMMALGGGAIVNMASLAGRNGFAGGAAYCASKHGVLGFSKALMMDVRQRGMRVIAVCPGSVNTPFFDKQTSFTPNRDRILAPDDVAQAVVAALELPAGAMVSELDIRPTNP